MNLVIRVRDNGVGISQEDRKNIFDYYFRSKSIQNDEHFNKESHGIGLSICKKIALGLGGDLILNEDSGAPGCEFELRLNLLKTKKSKHSRLNFGKQKIPSIERIMAMNHLLILQESEEELEYT